MARVRIHQHVNPLTPYYSQSPSPIDLATFKDPSLPILLDIGSARGRFLLRMAEAEPLRNYIGVEIREPLVDEANRLAAEAGLTNLTYSFCNAMLWLERLLEDIPAGLIQTVTIQFPDPWFKKKHAKRRMVIPDLVSALAAKLGEGGTVFVQTDIEFLGEEIFGLFRDEKRFTEHKSTENPFSVRTEREKAVEDKGLPVYRRLFTKK